jgi:2'-5' RNA ligase
MRLFIALELPDELRETLAETQGMLRGCIKGRFVGSDSLHLTLAFLGSVEAHRVPDIEEALQRACAGHDAIDASLGELGAFGRRSKSTLWQAVHPKHELAALAADVRAELRRSGFSFDEKTFLPHITLMLNADVSTGELPMPHMARGTVDTVTLFKSDLSGPRPVYEGLYSCELAQK